VTSTPDTGAAAAPVTVPVPVAVAVTVPVAVPVAVPVGVQAGAPTALPAAGAVLPDAPAESLPTPLPSPPRQGQNRVPYSLERSRQAVPYGVPAITHERISFTAACPACGADAEWVEVREDTRVRCAVHCACA